MKNLTGPFPSVAFNEQVAANALVPAVAVFSGELKADLYGTLGSPRVGGRVSDVWLSIGASGKDDSNTLSVEGDVLINGTTCLSTKPKIAHVSGEASQQKTTKVTGDTGITQRALATASTFSAGDVLTYVFDITRTATPTTEMDNAVLTVEFEPSK